MSRPRKPFGADLPGRLMSTMIKVEQDPRGHIANRAIGAGIQAICIA